MIFIYTYAYHTYYYYTHVLKNNKYGRQSNLQQKMFEKKEKMTVKMKQKRTNTPKNIKKMMADGGTQSLFQ